MENYKTCIAECMNCLRLIRFPCNGWKEDGVCFDKVEETLSGWNDSGHV